MSIIIRSEVPADIEAIEALTAAAFLRALHSSRTEHFIVNTLRKAGQLSISLVADDNGVVVGHVAVSPVFLSDKTEGWYGLGPIAVAPERQGQGIGTRLMRRVLVELKRLNAAGCVLLGEPSYYRRFSFQPEPALVLPGIPPEYFQALSFQGPIPVAFVTYHEAFNANE